MRRKRSNILVLLRALAEVGMLSPVSGLGERSLVIAKSIGGTGISASESSSLSSPTGPTGVGEKKLLKCITWIIPGHATGPAPGQ